MRVSLGLAGMLALAAVVLQLQALRPAASLVAVDARGTLRAGGFSVTDPVGDIAAVPDEMRWESVAGATRYQVRLSEVDRHVIWESSSDVNHLVLPAAARAKFIPTKTLYWEVLAISESGGQLGDTGLVRLRLLEHH